MENMIWFVLWAIAPLVPAILIYLILPRSSTSVDGVLKGLQVKLGGAAGLYFIVFFIMNPVKNGLIHLESNENSWHLETSFQNQKNEDVPITELVKAESIPELKTTALNRSTLLVDLPSVTIRENKITIPYYLHFIFSNYEATAISNDYLNNRNNCDILWDDKTIRLKNLPRLLTKANPENGPSMPANEKNL